MQKECYKPRQIMPYSCIIDKPTQATEYYKAYRQIEDQYNRIYAGTLFNSAFDACKVEMPSGGEIRLKRADSYLYKTKLAFDIDDLVLKGEGMRTRIKPFDTSVTDPAIEVTKVRCGFCDFNLYGREQFNSAGGINFITGSFQCFMRNLVIDAFAKPATTQYGLTFYHSWSNVGYNVTIQYTIRGMHFREGGGHNKFYGGLIGGYNDTYRTTVGILLDRESGTECDTHMFYGQDFQWCTDAIDIVDCGNYIKFYDPRFEGITNTNEVRADAGIGTVTIYDGIYNAAKVVDNSAGKLRWVHRDLEYQVIAGPGWVNPTGVVWNGRLVQQRNTAAGQSRLIGYSNGAWVQYVVV